MSQRTPDIPTFFGTSENTMDARNRVALPAHFRDVLNEHGIKRLYLVERELVDGFACLALYPESTWRDIWLDFETERDDAGADDEAALAVEYDYISGARLVELDGQGRVLIPGDFKERAGLSKQVTWAAPGDRMELWDRQRFSDLRSRVKGNKAVREFQRRKSPAVRRLQDSKPGEER